MARKEHFDVEAVRAKTLEYIAGNREKAAIQAKVEQVLLTFEGKQINKRMATAVQAALGEGYYASWRPQYSWHSILISNKTTLPYSAPYDVMIGYDSDTYPNGARKFEFAYWKQRYSDAHGNDQHLARAEKSEQALRFVEQRVNHYNEAVKEANAAYEALEGLATW
jgi:hypothetical protein